MSQRGTVQEFKHAKVSYNNFLVYGEFRFTEVSSEKTNNFVGFG